MKPIDSLPSISVVIPNRNDSAYLETCLNSVLNQSVAPDQIVFVDDQSTDQSLEIAKRNLSKFCDAQIIANPKCLGTMGALNEGLKKATCDYVLFLASNDYILEDLFERAKRSICETGFPGIWSAMVWAANEQGRPLYVYPSSVINLNGNYIAPKDCIRLAMRTSSWFMGTTLFFHRKALSDIGGFDTDYQGLADLLAALTISSTNGATFLAEPLGVMRMHGDGYLSGTMADLENLERILSIIDRKGPLLSPRLFEPVFRSRLRDRFRFAAIRAIDDIEAVKWPESWNGTRYHLFEKLAPLMKINKLLRTVIALLLIRPFDIPQMFFYRFIGSLLIKWRTIRKDTTNHLRKRILVQDHGGGKV